MLKEYDVVVSNKELINVPKGSRGTILIVYEDGNHFEVEFVDIENNTLSVLTVTNADIDQWNNNE